MTNVELWRKKYGKVYSLKLENKEVLFRLLTARELLLIKDKDTKADRIIADLVILNKIELKLPGSLITLAKKVIQRSISTTDDELILKIIQKRNKIRESPYLTHVVRLCKLFPYTPDQLLDKTEDQLLELIAMAESMTGKEIISTSPKTNLKSPKTRDAESFNKPDPSPLMDESKDALSKVLEKHGKKVKEFKKESKPTDPVNKQMQDLNRFVSG